jgi:hypothetical protein
MAQIQPAEIEDMGFWRWIDPMRLLRLRRRHLPVLLSGLLGLVPIVSQVIARGGLFSLPDAEVYRVSLWIQALVILLLLWMLPRGYARPIAPIEAEQRTVHVFLGYWRWVWISWFALYALFLAAEYGAANVPAATFAVLVHLANNLQTCFVVVCYWALVTPSVSQIPKGQGHVGLPPIVGLVILLALLEALLGDQENARVFAWLSGIGAGLAFAMFVARLESVSLGAPRGVIIALYCYAMLQPGVVLLDEPAWQVWIINLALALKVLFFAVIAWAVSSGRLLFYVRAMQGLHTS